MQTRLETREESVGLIFPLSYLPPSFGRSPIDLSHQLALSAPSLTITTPLLLPVLLEAYSLLEIPPNVTEIKRRTVLTSSDESKKAFSTLQELMEEGAALPEAAQTEVHPGETSVICFSSGTEGLSKGVE